MERKKKRALRKLKDYLKSQEMVLTVPRKIIFSAIFEFPAHFETEDLVEKLKEGENRVSRGSIYRTLKVLEEAGLIRRMQERISGAYYELTFGFEHHDHLICESCGKIIEFLDKDIEKLQKKVCRREGFRARRHSLQIFGLCRECLEKGKGRKGQA